MLHRQLAAYLDAVDQRFGMTVVLPRVRAKQQGEHLEIDVLA
jgi:hypothetical protein